MLLCSGNGMGIGPPISKWLLLEVVKVCVKNTAKEKARQRGTEQDMGMDNPLHPRPCWPGVQENEITNFIPFGA